MITFSYQPHCSGHAAARFHRAFNCIQITFFLIIIEWIAFDNERTCMNEFGLFQIPQRVEAESLYVPL